MIGRGATGKEKLANQIGTIHSQFVTDTQRDTPSADPARPEPSPARPENCAPDRVPDETDFYLRMMHRATEIVMATMERVAAEPDTKTAVEGISELTRSMRLCAALANKLQNDRFERDRKASAEHAATVKERKARHKAQVERLVEQAVEREIERAEEAGERLDGEALHEAAYERLEEDDFERDLDKVPTSELVARVCRDCGFEPDLEFWRQQQWALEEARRKPPGSPYATEPEPEAVRPEAAKPPEPEPPPEVKPPDPPAPLPLELDPRFDPRRAPTPEVKRWMEAHLKHLRGGR